MTIKLIARLFHQKNRGRFRPYRRIRLKVNLPNFDVTLPENGLVRPAHFLKVGNVSFFQDPNSERFQH